MDNQAIENGEREAIDAALRIVGAEDFSDDGCSGEVVVHGAFANAIISEQLQSLETRKRFGVEGEPVQVRRYGHLEFRCNGFWVEGTGVRRIVHSAARKVLGITSQSS
jgi:hypothetical protein